MMATAGATLSVVLPVDRTATGTETIGALCREAGTVPLELVPGRGHESVRLRAERAVSGALPTYLIIGAAKCGTTSLHHYLGRSGRASPARKTSRSSGGLCSI